MKKYNLFLSGLMAIALTACTNDNILPEGGHSAEKITVTAYAAGNESPSSRVDQEMDSKNKLNLEWSDDDQFSVIRGNNFTNFIKKENEYAFEGYLPNGTGNYFAVYPVINTSEATHAAVPFDISNQTNVFPYLMYAMSPNGLTYQFHHAVAYLKATFPDLKGEEATITITTPSGVYTKGNINLTNGALSGGSKSTITKQVTFGAESAEAWFALPPMVATNKTLQFNVETADGQEYTATLEGTEDRPIEAGMYYSATINDLQEKTLCELPTGDSFNSALKNTANFANATSIIFDAKSTRTGGMQIGQTEAYTIVEGNILYVYTAADVFMFKQTSSYMFKNLSGISEIDFGESINTSNVTSMQQMFNGCSSLASLDLSNFNTSNVTNMEYMFSSCSSFESLDLSNFDTSKVMYMSYMFSGCSSLASLDLSNFGTSNVTSIQNMFSGCSGLASLDLSNFDTSKVKYMSGMFQGCTGLESLDLSKFNTSNVINMEYMFYGCTGLTSLDLSKFDTSNVENMSSMFMNCTGLISLKLSSFDTSKVLKMSSMFNGCSSLTSLNLPSTFDASNVNHMNNMFMNCSGLTSIDCVFKASKVSNTEKMFYGCSSLESLDLSDFSTSSTESKTYMTSMFEGCSMLVSLELSDSFCTYVVYGMGSMFKNCSSLTSLDLSNFDTSNVESMISMFEGCSGFTSLHLCSFTFKNSEYRRNMFYKTSADLKVYVKDEAEQSKLRSRDIGNSLTGISNSNNIVVCETHNQ